MQKLFILLAFLVISLNASIDFTQNSDRLLLQTQIYLDTESLNVEQIQESTSFYPCTSEHLNFGFMRNTSLWIKVKFYNKLQEPLTKILEVKNPLLENVTLYEMDAEILKISPHRYDYESINAAFVLTLNGGETKEYYIKVTTATTVLRLGLSLSDERSFVHDDHQQQTIVFVFMSILLLLFAYNILLFTYTKERAYIYYSLYLATLIYQQSTYLGITQIYFPSWFVYYDNLIVVLKVNAMYITAAIFAKSFLQTKKYPKIDRIYNYIILVAIIEIPLVGTPWFYFPEVAILTSLVFVVFNVLTGFYIYKQGCKQARLFVMGWFLLAIGFILMILDGLGVVSVMHRLSNIILLLTAFEAIILSLAFTDRYMILKAQKEESDTLLFERLKENQIIIESEIEKRTSELNRALENTKVLLKELHHRTKNNLQLILSLIRMQSDRANSEIQTYSQSLEYRINSIARMHQKLYLGDDWQQINMNEYINELSSDLENLTKKDVKVNVGDKEIYLPFKDAGYIGLILNELITNSIKYSVSPNIIIDIQMYRVEKNCKIIYIDNGLCYDFFEENRTSIGLKLVRTLVENQLAGAISVTKKNGCEHVIEFEI